MKIAARFITKKIRESLKYDLREKTILFLGSDGASLQGNAFALAQKALRDERLQDWHLIWTVPNVEGIEELALGGQQDSPRMELVRENSPGFLEALETAAVIVAGTFLPAFFVKRKGQTAVGVLADDCFAPEQRVTEERAFLQQTLCKLDLLYLEGPAAPAALQKWYPQGTPFRTIAGEPLRYALEETGAAAVVASFSESVLGRTYADMEARFKMLDRACAAHRKSLFMRIPYSAWRCYREENAPEVLRRIGSSYAPLWQSVQSAEAVVTDRVGEMRESLRNNIPCVFLSAAVGTFGSLIEEHPGRLKFAGSWDEACEALQQLLPGEKPAAETVGRKKEKAARAAEELVTAILEGEPARKPAAAPGRKKELFLLLNYSGQALLRALGSCRRDADVSVLFTDPVRLFRSSRFLDDCIRVYLKSAPFLSSSAERCPPAALENIWKQLVGNETFDVIYAKETTDPLWKQLYACAPSQKLEIFPQKKLLDMVLGGLQNPVLRNLDAAETPFPTETVDGERYYRLGARGTEQFFLRCKGPVHHPALLFTGSRSDREPALRQVEKDPSYTYFLIDPGRHLEGAEILERENVYWLPVPLLPVRLFLYAEAVFHCEDRAVRKVASVLGKKLRRLPGMGKTETKSARWELLDVQSDEEML